MSGKQRFSAGLAQMVADELCFELGHVCEPDRLTVAGSLRRKQTEVGDLEILFVPKKSLSTPPGHLLEVVREATDPVFERWLAEKRLSHRRNINGSATWGPAIKLAVHEPSCMPVDFFTSSEESWWNYLVCRTGPAASNVRIATAARDRGWQWAPYSPGFYRVRAGLEKTPELHAVKSEREVFEFVGLKYLEPEERI